MYRMLFILLFFAVTLRYAEAQQVPAPDRIECEQAKNTIRCSIYMSHFIARIMPILSNGWENNLRFEFLLASDKIRKTTSTGAKLRCYIDPFESPCLVLWEGSDNIRNYNDEIALQKSLSLTRMSLFKLKSLENDTYTVTVRIILNPVTKEQNESIRNWLLQSGQQSMTLGEKNESSFMGAITGTFAKFNESMADDSLVLGSLSFKIEKEEP